MYKTIYKSPHRFNSFSQAITTQISKKNTDLFLYLIDLYDLLVGDLPINHTEYRTLKTKLKSYLLENYELLYKPIPGCLLGWTHAMFFWIVYLSLLNKKPIPANNYRAYVRSQKIRQYKDPDPRTWSWDVLVNTLDILCLKWDELEITYETEQFLEILWHLASKFTLFIHTKDILSVDNHVEYVKKTKYHVRLSAEAIVTVLSRFVGFNRSLEVCKKWSYEIETFPSEHNFSSFIYAERRHLITRKFRDNIVKWMWDKLLLIGDKDIASHDQLGEQVSANTCLYKRNPTGQMTNWQRLLTYSDYDDIIKDKKMKNFLHLHFIDQHFSTAYNVNFLKHFVVFNVFKNKEKILNCVVPLIIKIRGRFEVYYNRKLYEGGDIDNAFIMWCHILKTKCNSKPYTMDFSILTTSLFTMDSSDEENRIEGFFTLEDDDL